MELSYLAFDHCLHGPSLEDYAGVVDSSRVNELLSSGGFSPCTLDSVLREQCRTMVGHREAIYPDLVEAQLLALDYEPETFAFDSLKECGSGA